MAGIMRKVDPFPMPEVMKSTRKARRKPTKIRWSMK
jgi:hypothetical protein